MLLDIERGSIVKFFQNLNNVPVYIELIPENMKIPSMYFPIPMTEGYRASLASYTKDNQMFVKVFDKDTLLAFNAAENITNSLLEKNNLIPVCNPDGSLTENYIRIDRVVSRKIDEGIVQVEINWKSNRKLYKAPSEKIKNIWINIKTGG